MSDRKGILGLHEQAWKATFEGVWYFDAGISNFQGAVLALRTGSRKSLSSGAGVRLLRTGGVTPWL